jgi:hypothetical protein
MPGARKVQLHGHGWHASEAHEEIHAKVEDLCALMIACNILVRRGSKAKASRLPPSKVARQKARHAMAVLKRVATSRPELTPQQSLIEHFCNGGKIVPNEWRIWRISTLLPEPSTNTAGPVCPCGGSCTPLRQLLNFPADLPLVDYNNKNLHAGITDSEKLVEFVNSLDHMPSE